jgi:hypothetical protein
MCDLSMRAAALQICQSTCRITQRAHQTLQLDRLTASLPIIRRRSKIIRSHRGKMDFALRRSNMAGETQQSQHRTPSLQEDPYFPRGSQPSYPHYIKVPTQLSYIEMPPASTVRFCGTVDNYYCFFARCRFRGVKERVFPIADLPVYLRTIHPAAKERMKYTVRYFHPIVQGR